MRNLRLLATVLFVAVLLVGIVFLLKQTNTSTDASVTSVQPTTTQKLAVNTTAQTDPPMRVSKANGAKIANGVKPVRTQLENSSRASAKTSATQAELTPIDGLSISTKQPSVANRTQQTNTTAKKTTSWNPNASKAEQIRSLEQMLREESNPRAKAKIQHKLNSLK